MLKRLVDPSAGNELASLRKQDDFAIAAAAQRCLVLDNISRVSGDYSDALARAATGGGEIARTLYTDSDVHSVRAEAAVIFTSIADVLHRPDLADRTLLLALEQPRARATDWAVWARFEGEWSLLLGALLDGLVGVLRYEGEVTAVLDMETAPRMIDPFIWTLAAGRAWGWPERQVIAQFADERRCLETDLLEGDPVFPLIAGFVRNNTNGVFGDWEGTTAELFEGIRERLFMISKAEQVALPRSPRGLTSHLNRLAPPMRTAGWGVGRRWVGVGAASRHMWVIVPPSE
jgi:hypothetical protein